MVGLACPSAGLIEPLYTTPKPPSPILSNLLKLLVASLSSNRENTLKLCSLSLYISGMPLGDDIEPVDLVTPRSSPEFCGFLVFLNSGADFVALDLHLFLNMLKHFIVLWKWPQISWDLFTFFTTNKKGGRKWRRIERKKSQKKNYEREREMRAKRTVTIDNYRGVLK